MDVNILLFPDFETLDAFGPVEVLGRIEEYKLHYISMFGGMITSRQGTKIVTETVKEANTTGILLIPGGQGTRPLVKDTQFIEMLANLAETSTYCLTVCTGAALLAKTGCLNGVQATSNKKAFDWVESINPAVLWLRKARWTSSPKYYTSSGVSAGIDMTLAFIAEQFGHNKAQEIAAHIEYIWNTDPNNDPFTKPCL